MKLHLHYTDYSHCLLASMISPAITLMMRPRCFRRHSIAAIIDKFTMAFQRAHRCRCRIYGEVLICGEEKIDFMHWRSHDDDTAFAHESRRHECFQRFNTQYDISRVDIIASFSPITRSRRYEIFSSRLAGRYDWLEANTLAGTKMYC